MDDINAGYERLAELQVPSYFHFSYKYAFSVKQLFFMDH
jgi:hypothetical protein